MKNKFLVFISVVFLVAAILVATNGFATGDQEVAVEDSGALKVGLILTTSGLGDNNFNDMAYNGLVAAGETFGISYNYGEPETISDYEMQQRSFAATGDYDLIIVIGSDQVEGLEIVAKDFPDQHFTFIDGSLDLPNVHSIFTRFEDQMFLTGVHAGLMTSRKDFPMINGENKKIGIIVGMDLPISRNAIAGYMAGAKYVDSEVDILVGDVGSFNDPGKAKEIAMSMYGKGVDFIQLGAGGSGLGIINAAVEAKAYAFGGGANQNGEQPEHIAATAIRNVNEIVYNDIMNYYQDKWMAGVDAWGIKESAVGYSREMSKVQLPADVIETIEEIRMKLVEGKIVPPNNVDDVETWSSNNKY